MNTKIIPVLLLILIILNCANSIQDKSENFRIVPREAIKRIISTYYKPILHNGKWICGEEIKPYNLTPDTTYYDKYNNILLNVCKDADYIIKNIYSLPQYHRLEKSYIRYSDRTETIEYRYNPQGILTESILSGKNSLFYKQEPEHCFYNYDNQGNKIKPISNSKKVLIKELPFDGEIIVKIYQIIDANCKYSYDKIPGLIEKGTEIYDIKTGLLQRKISEFYKHGELERMQDTYLTHNNKGQIVKEETDCRRKASYYGTDIHYQEEKWYRKWIYNELNDIIFYISENSNPNNDLEVNKNLSKKYEYEYNDKHDWTKKFTFSITDKDIGQSLTKTGEYSKEKLKGNIEYITVRDIKYY